LFKRADYRGLLQGLIGSFNTQAFLCKIFSVRGKNSRFWLKNCQCPLKTIDDRGFGKCNAFWSIALP